MTGPATPDQCREYLLTLLDGIRAWDELERRHLAFARQWAASSAPLHRTAKPDVPSTHLVSYFLACDELAGRVLLVDHRRSGLWLPSGGHVEPGEDPWDTVVRECAEELHTSAVPSAAWGMRPAFLTVTATRAGPGRHTDVSLWYVLRSRVDAITSYDEREFAGIRWLSFEEVLAEPIARLDPHMHRFTGKLIAMLDPVPARQRGQRTGRQQPAG